MIVIIYLFKRGMLNSLKRYIVRDRKLSASGGLIIYTRDQEMRDDDDQHRKAHLR